jgi:hypothetical protein
MTTASILELAETISTHTKILHNHLTTHNLPLPSFNHDYPLMIDLSPQILASQEAFLNVSSDMRALMLGPIRLLQNLANVSLTPTMKSKSHLLRTYRKLTTS